MAKLFSNSIYLYDCYAKLLMLIYLNDFDIIISYNRNPAFILRNIYSTELKPDFLPE